MRAKERETEDVKEERKGDESGGKEEGRKWE